MQRTREEIAPLVALYAPLAPAARATNPVGEDAHTMEPGTPAWRIFLIACLHAKKAPVRLVSMTPRTVAAGSSSTKPTESMAAISNRPLGAPILFETVLKAFSTCS